MSPRHLEVALTETMEVEGVSKRTVRTPCNQFEHDCERWQNWDLSDQDSLCRLSDSSRASFRFAAGSRHDFRIALSIPRWLFIRNKTAGSDKEV